MATSPETQATKTRASRDPNVEAFCEVWDRDAKVGQTRVHIIDRTQYALHSDLRKAGTKVPLEHAIRFIKVRTMLVLDADRNQIMLDNDPAEDGFDVKKLGLPPYMVLAKWAELSTEALVARCRKLPGGHAITRNSGRERLIDFAMAGGLPDNTKKISPLDSIGIPVRNLKPGETVAEMIARHQDEQLEKGEEGEEAVALAEGDGDNTDLADALLGPVQIPGAKARGPNTLPGA